MSSVLTACPLDCYDACEIVYDNGAIKASKVGFTQGFLCPHLNHWSKHETIKTARFDGVEIELSEALEVLASMIKDSQADEILHYRGSGNFALMQEVSDHFFASFGATLTEGTLCDGAGEIGILEGRGSNKNMPITEIAKSEVVIFWGRNPHVTSSHLLPLIKGKEIIVIDPQETRIAKEADLFIQIRPHTDIYLAMLLSRFAHIENLEDTLFLEQYGSGFEDYYELTQGIRIKATLDAMGVSLGQIGDLLKMVSCKKVAIVVGLGVQKYEDGVDVMRSIDAFAATLGLFGREGCGVSYLGSSRANIDSPFTKTSRRVSKVNVDFSQFKTVFVQGANPLSQMPNSTRVKETISGVQNLVYFGLHENETSASARLVIPAKEFLYKNDIRTSYSHNAIAFMPKVADSDIGISEYELSRYLCERFGIVLESEEFYLEHFKKFAEQKDDGLYRVVGREEIPYVNGFDTDDGEFVFPDEFSAYAQDDDSLYLITCKSLKSLNSQFERNNVVFIHPELGYMEGEMVEVSSVTGSARFEVKHETGLRKDCIMIHSGTYGVNNLTTHKHSLSSKSAIFQENKVWICR